MKTSGYACFSKFVAPLLMTFLVSGCATQSVSKERLEMVAVITSGSTNAWLALKAGPASLKFALGLFRKQEWSHDNEK
jgi:hypothetical protein